MSLWKDTLKKLANSAESKFDQLSDRLNFRFGSLERISIVLHNAYSNEKTLFLSGRVLEDKGMNKPTDKDGLLNNLLNTYKRLETNEVPKALLEVSFQGKVMQAYSDEEGYFNIEMPLGVPLAYSIKKHTFRIKLLDFSTGGHVNADGQEGEIFLPPPTAEFGVISDIDDTIVRTNATELLRMAWATFMQNARTRVAFKGVASFYEGLRKGRTLGNDNPFFYVSSSPWNLFDLISDFIDINNIPKGPIMLRDYGIDETKLIVSTHGLHKRERIEHIFKAYPSMKFILIGDSGQEDAFIYYEAARAHRDRVLAIYIRDAGVPSQEERVRNAIQKANSEGIDMTLVPDSLVAARYAVGKGFMHFDVLAEIEKEMEDEEKNDSAMDSLEQGQ